MCFSSRCFFVWRVRHCRSSDYGKCVPHLGSTWVREVSEEEGVTGQQGYEKVGLECRDTGKPAEKDVSRIGFDSKEGKRGSDTGKSAEKGVSRMGYDSKAVERCSDTGKSAEKGVSRTG